MKKLMLLITVLQLCVSARASISDTLRESGPGPVLGGHLFQPIVGIPMPLLRTTSQVSVGFGQTLNLQLPEITIGNRIVIAPQGNLVIASMNVAHEQRIKDWLSVHAGLRLVGRLGTNVVSLLSQGVNTVGGATLGWKVRVLETENFIGSVSFDLSNGSVTTVDVQRFLKGIVDSNALVSDNPLLDTKPALSAGLAGRFGYVFSPAWSIMGHVSGVYGEPGTRDSSASSSIFLDAGLGTTVDLRPLTDVPIALATSVLYRQIPTIEDAASGKAVTTLSMRVGYSGSQHFAIGVQVNGQFTKIEGASEAFFVGAGLDMRFYY